MYETALEQFWQLLGWVLALNEEAFEQINTLPHGSTVAIIVVLAAGLSQVAAQSVILFLNRVKPVRFIFSLVVGAVLFAFGYIFLVCSTWAIGFAPFTVEAPFGVLARTLAFGYAPLIFSVFGAMPYFGEPILSVLSLWQLLAIVVGFASINSTNLWQAFGTVALGWITLWILQRTIGQPIAQFGHWIACKTAGVELITKREKFESFIQALRLDSIDNPSQVNIPNQNALASEAPQLEEITQTREQYKIFNSSQSSISTSTESNAAIASSDDTTKNGGFKLSSIVRQLRGFAILATITFVAVILLSPIRYWWFAC